MKLECSVCKKEINKPGRIVVYYNYRGKNRVIDNLHNDCWSKVCEFWQQSNGVNVTVMNRINKNGILLRTTEEKSNFDGSKSRKITFYNKDKTIRKIIPWRKVK